MLKNKNKVFAVVDILYLVMAILPFLALIILKILTDVPSEGISVTGAKVFFTIPMPLQDFPVTESQFNSLAVVISIFFLCLYFTHGLSERADLKRQHIAEWIIEKVDGLVKENMGEYFKGYTPFIISILGLSAFSSLSSLLGLYPPTSDLNVVAGWAILVFILITYYKLKCGFWNYLKGFTEPTPVLTPINIIGEFATPVSMAFRHYGNVLSGTVVSVLVMSALGGLSNMLLGWLPGILSGIPLFKIGIPAVLSIYFDAFSGCLQAFIFAMLTMLNISTSFPLEEYELRKQAKKDKKENKIKI